MHYSVTGEFSGRIRFRLNIPKSLQLSKIQLEGIYSNISGIIGFKTNLCTRSIVIHYKPEAGIRELLIKAVESCQLSYFLYKNNKEPEQEGGLEKKKKEMWFKTTLLIFGRFLPLPIQTYFLATGAYGVIKEGLKSIANREINAEVLDAAAVSGALLLKDFGTARTIIYLLQAGEYLDEWTKHRSKESLTKLLSLNEDWVWVQKDGQEIRVAAKEIKKNDLVIARSGSQIPVDGIIVSGEAMVNQASLTGEAMPVKKHTGNKVFAGTVISEGELIVQTEKIADQTRISQIVKVIEVSEKLKAGVQSNAEKLADKIVPYSFLLAGFTWLLTGNAVKAVSALLVDYSCAIKLSTPLTIMSAMITSSKKGVLIKGGKYIEALSKMDAIVLDKTGTLTIGHPEIVEVTAFNGYDRDYILRNVACVEEHFPHPVAKAVVERAEREDLIHDERHSKVRYIMAHGVESELDGKRILVGSRHFIEEDNHISVKRGEKQIQKHLEKGRSILYVSIADELVGVLAIEDPIRMEAGSFLNGIQQQGVKHVAMLTGDNSASAGKVASDLQIENYKAQVFPEDKADYVTRLKEDGYTVGMIGDGMNDSIALSQSDIGISLGQASDMAKETSNIVLLKEDLNQLVIAQQLSKAAMKRIHQNFRTIVGINSALIFMGIFGITPPIFSAFMHNATTVFVALKAVQPLSIKQEVSNSNSLLN